MKIFIACLILSISTLTTAANSATHLLSKDDFSSPPKRVVSIEWAMTETLLGLNVTPVGMADMDGYKQWVKTPTLPTSIVDVGARNEPNLEVIAELKPDLILITSGLSSAYSKLSKIAPTMMFDVYNKQQQPLAQAKNLTLTLGELLAKTSRAKQLVKDTERLLKHNGELIHSTHPNLKPLLFVRIIDNSSLHFQGKGSLIDDTIHAMGLSNEWQGKTNMWGFSSVAVANIAEHQNTQVFLLQSVKKAAKETLIHSPLWQAMAFSREHRVHELPPVWSYGGLLAVQNFSNQLVSLLTQTQ